MTARIRAFRSSDPLLAAQSRAVASVARAHQRAAEAVERTADEDHRPSLRARLARLFQSALTIPAGRGASATGATNAGEGGRFSLPSSLPRCGDES